MAQSRRHTARATDSAAAISSGAAYRLRKRWAVPMILSPCSARPESSAFEAATNGVREVRAGIPNHSAATTRMPPTISHRIERIARQAQIEYSPRNTHTSGRPSAASTANTKAQRYRRERWQSIAPRHRETIIGSDWALRM